MIRLCTPHYRFSSNTKLITIYFKRSCIINTQSGQNGFYIHLNNSSSQQQKMNYKSQAMNSNTQGFSSLTIFLHLMTLLLIYAYIKEQLTFSFIFALSPSILVFLAEGYEIVTTTKGVTRAKYLISYCLLIMFFIILGRVIKNQGGMKQNQDDQQKWLVRHRKCFEILVLAMASYVFYDLINHQKYDSPSVVKQVMLNILSSLSTPLTICSGGACNSIYISTITSILSSFSIPLTLAVPLLNLLGYILQIVGLVSLYSAKKWYSASFWIYLLAMVVQIVSSHHWANWICCAAMIFATILNAKTNQFIYGKNKKLFIQSIV